MQVTNVTVSYGRTRQPAKYESSEAKVEWAVTLTDGVSPGENHVEATKRLLGEAKTLVLTELNLVEAGQSASAHDYVKPAAQVEQPIQAASTAAPAAAEKPKGTPGRKKNVPAPPPGGPGENRIGPEDIDPTAPAVVAVAAAATASDIPDGSGAPVAAKVVVSTTSMSAGEVHSYVTSLVKENKLAAPQVKALTRKFGQEKISDLDPSKLPEYKAEIDKMVAASDI